MFEIKKFLFQFTTHGFVTLLLMSSVLAASETLDANDSPINEKQEGYAIKAAIVAKQAQTDTDRQAEVKQEDLETEKQQNEYTDAEEEHEEDRELDDEFDLEDGVNEDREYPIEDFDMDNINDREIGDFFDDQNNVDFRREGQIMKG